MRTGPLWRWLAVLGIALNMLIALPALSDPEDDKSLLVRTLQDLLSDAGREVRIDGFEGALSSQATIEQISIADDLGVWITLQGVVIDWNRTELLQRRVAVNELSARQIVLERVPQAEPASDLPRATAREGFRLPELPVSVHIGQIEAERVVLGGAVLGEPAVVWAQGAVELNGGQGNARFAAERIDGTEGQFHIVGGFDNLSRLLNLDIALSEGQGGIVSKLLGIPDAPSLALTASGTGPIASFTADVSLAVNGTQHITGRFGLVDETPDTRVINGGRFELSLAGDLRPLLVPDLHPFFGETSSIVAAGTRAETGEIALDQLAVTTQSLTLEGRAALSANGFPTQVALNARIADPTGAMVLLPGTNGEARLRQASLVIQHDAGQGRDWQMRAEIEHLALPQVQIESAVLDGTGRLNPLSDPTQDTASNAPAFEGVFEYAVQGVGASNPGLAQALGDTSFGLASLSWPGVDQPLEVTGLGLESDAVSLTAYGQLRGATFDGFAEVEAHDIALFSGLAGRALSGHALASLQGQVNPLTGAADIVATLNTQDLTVDVAEVDALLAGEAGINLSLVRNTQGTILREFDLRAGPVALDARGMFDGQQSELSANLTARDLARLGEGYGGELALRARLDGQPARQRLRFEGHATDLSLADLPGVGQMRDLFRGDTVLQGDVSLVDETLHFESLTLDGTNLSAQITGRAARNAPNVDILLHRFSLASLGQGGQGDLSGRVGLVTSDTGDTDIAFTLQGPAPLRSGIRALDGLISDGLSAELSATQVAGQTGITLHAARLRSGGLNARASGRVAADGAQDITLEAQLASLGHVVPGLSGAVLLEGRASRAAGQDRTQVSVVLNGPSNARISAAGHMDPDGQLDVSLSGELQGSMINPVIEPSNVSGLIRVSGRVQGPPRMESLNLHLETTNARYVQPNAGVSFDNITASADVQALSAQVHVEGRSLNGGQGQLSGRIGLTPNAQSDLSVNVRDFIVRLPGLFEADISGGIRLTGALRRDPFVQGTVQVNRAEIRIPNSPLSGQVRTPQGLRHVGETAQSRGTRRNAGIARGTSFGRRPVPIRLDLTLEAPRRIFVRGRGLDAELGGYLRLGGTTRDVVPAGSFGLVRGRLDLLGNRFDLTDGSASMVGSFLPYVSLTATTESDGVTTGITLSGVADEPEISFWSTPELPEDEVLARLIFRRSLTSLTPFQAAQLALSVATLTGRVESSFLGRTREALSLDDLDLTVDEQGNTALRAGRYINERVYTDVSVNNTGRGEVSINLDLTDDVTLRGRTDTDGRSGLGLFFERDY